MQHSRVFQLIVLDLKPTNLLFWFTLTLINPVSSYDRQLFSLKTNNVNVYYLPSTK